MYSATDLFTVSKTEALVRLDKLLSLHFPKYSRTYFQYLIEEGCVVVNGKISKKKTILEEGDEIEICFRLLPEISLSPEPIPLDILYEDEAIIVVNKPAGMVVHPAPGSPCHTFVNALLYHCHNLPNTATLRPGIVHRLDKDTSGVLIAAKTTEAHQKLVLSFAERRVQKKYLALCKGSPGTREIALPLKRHPTRRQEMAVLPEGKEAISRCTVLQEKKEFSLVEVELVTGRTHQIRVHLKHVGAPILGDPVYGDLSMNKKWSIHRQLLHAYSLEITHPLTEKKCFFTAPLPPDMLSFLENLHMPLFFKNL